MVSEQSMSEQSASMSETHRPQQTMDPTVLTAAGTAALRLTQHAHTHTHTSSFEFHVGKDQIQSNLRM